MTRTTPATKGQVIATVLPTAADLFDDEYEIIDPTTSTKKLQVSDKQKLELEKQQYRFVGSHSAVKVCGWTKNMLRGEGGCYKFTFYGIRSHQCMQMTTSMFCGSRCTFCWRGEKAPVAKGWYGPVDDPEHIINHAIDAHLALLEGFKGNPKVTPARYEQSEQVRHVALSLTGEPIAYPRLLELLAAFHERHISTFLVSNAQYPEQMAAIKYITQLYLSIDAPNKELLQKIDRPLFPDFWDRMLACLDILGKATYRTCIRLTLIKDVNMVDFEGYAALINRGKPHFIELKSYMHVGASRKYHERSNMPSMDEVKSFSHDLLRHLPDYVYASDHEASRVTLLVRKDMVATRWIDFPRFFAAVDKQQPLTAKEYSCATIARNE